MTRGCGAPSRSRSIASGSCRWPRAPRPRPPPASCRRPSGRTASARSWRPIRTAPGRLLDEAGYADRADLGTIVVNGNGPRSSIRRSPSGAMSSASDVEIENDGLRRLPRPGRHDGRRRSSRSTGSPTTPRRTPSTGCCWSRAPRATTGDWRDDDLRRPARRGRGVRRTRLGPPTRRSMTTSPSRRRSSRGPTARPGGSSRDGLRGLGNLTIGLLDFGRVSWDG